MELSIYGSSHVQIEFKLLASKCLQPQIRMSITIIISSIRTKLLDLHHGRHVSPSFMPGHINIIRFHIATVIWHTLKGKLPRAGDQLWSYTLYKLCTVCLCVNGNKFGC